MPDPQDTRKGPVSPPEGRASGNGSLRKFAYDQVEDLLNTGQLTPGQLVSQRELVALTGATLGSIREAVARFEAEGLLITVPKKGLMVPSLDVAFVRDAYQVRQMIEVVAVPYMVERLRDREVEDFLETFEKLNEERQTQGDEVSQDLLDKIQREDWRMHSTFVACAGNALMDNIYRVTAIKIRLAVQSRLRVTNSNAGRVHQEHLDILKPLAKRDAAATEAALIHHVQNSLQVALGLEPGSGL